MIFTLINSINKACRGRIYTRDYIGSIKKEKKNRGEAAWGDNKEGGGDAGREQAAWWKQTDTDGREQGFIWDYLRAYTKSNSQPHTHKHTRIQANTHTYRCGNKSDSISLRDKKKIGAFTGEMFKRKGSN